jgi:hypothetical protein
MKFSNCKQTVEFKDCIWQIMLLSQPFDIGHWIYIILCAEFCDLIRNLYCHKPKSKLPPQKI